MSANQPAEARSALPPVVVASPAGRAPRRVGPKGAARRDTIMDAAEEVFCERGYYGSSLREVSARSNAALGLINHYFPSKEVLFFEVVARKKDKLARLVSDSLDRSVREQGNDRRSIVEGFIAPFLRACVDEHSDIRSYIRLTSHFMSAYRVPELRAALQSLIPISQLFSDRLRASVPELSEAHFNAAVYIIEAALIFMVQDAGFLESLSEGGYRIERIDELIRPMAIFFEAGLVALEQTPPLPRTPA